MLQKFRASTQYGDWRGDVAADDADSASLRNYLEKESLVKVGEFLIGTSIWIGENSLGNIGQVYVKTYFLAASHEGYDNVKECIAGIKGAIPVRVVDLSFSLEQYILLFKRLDIVMTARGLDLSGREYIETI